MLRYGYGRLNYYNEEKVWISGQLITIDNEYYITPPENTKYIRVSGSKTRYPIDINNSKYLGTNFDITYPIYKFSHIKVENKDLLKGIVKFENLADEVRERNETSNKPELIVGSNRLEAHKITKNILTS